jgi:hypothetical protein
MRGLHVEVTSELHASCCRINLSEYVLQHVGLQSQMVIQRPINPFMDPKPYAMPRSLSPPRSSASHMHSDPSNEEKRTLQSQMDTQNQDSEGPQVCLASIGSTPAQAQLRQVEDLNCMCFISLQLWAPGFCFYLFVSFPEFLQFKASES